MQIAAQRMNDYLNTNVVSPADRDGKSTTWNENQFKKPQSDGRMIRKSQGAHTSQGLNSKDEEVAAIKAMSKSNAIRVARAASETRDISNADNGLNLADAQNSPSKKMQNPHLQQIVRLSNQAPKEQSRTFQRLQQDNSGHVVAGNQTKYSKDEKASRGERIRKRGQSISAAEGDDGKQIKERSNDEKGVSRGQKRHQSVG